MAVYGTAAILAGRCLVGVNLVFAAFLAGFAVVHKKRRISADALEAISKASFAFFIPVYLRFGIKARPHLRHIAVHARRIPRRNLFIETGISDACRPPAFAEYLFFATVETVCTSVIIWQAWTWSELEPSSLSQTGSSSARQSSAH